MLSDSSRQSDRLGLSESPHNSPSSDAVSSLDASITLAVRTLRQEFETEFQDKHLSIEGRIGEGGFGMVYKGAPFLSQHTV
jgi:hypothetical protein